MIPYDEDPLYYVNGNQSLEELMQDYRLEKRRLAEIREAMKGHRFMVAICRANLKNYMQKLPGLIEEVKGFRCSEEAKQALIEVYERKAAQLEEKLQYAIGNEGCDAVNEESCLIRMQKLEEIIKNKK